jgi:signal peptidase I
VTANVRRQVRNVAGWVLVGIVIFLGWPAQLGGNLSLVVVSGHSMDGTYRTGDLLLAWPDTDYHVGEIVVYQIPKGEPGAGFRVVHRVINKENGHFTTQGDNRDTSDMWQPTVHDVVGHPFFRIRAGGLALKWLLSPIALALVVGVCVYWAVVSKDDEEEGEAPDGNADDGDTGSRDEDASELETAASR